MESAPETIVLQVHVEKEKLDLIGDDVNEETFRKGLKEYGRREYKGKSDWKSYSAWLLETDKRKPTDIAIMNGAPTDDTVVLSSMECHKTDKIEDKMEELTKKLGIHVSVFACTLVNEQCYKKSSRDWGLFQKVGQNAYFPIDGSIALQVKLLVRKASDIRKANQAFIDSLLEIKTQSQQTDRPKHYLLIDNPEETSDNEGDDDEKVKKKKF